MNNITNQIEWTAKARKGLSKINDMATRKKVYTTVTELQYWPKCHLNIIRLQGRSDYRLRVGNYRVVFTIDTKGNPIIITINQVEKRDEHTY